MMEDRGLRPPRKQAGREDPPQVSKEAHPQFRAQPKHRPHTEAAATQGSKGQEVAGEEAKACKVAPALNNTWARAMSI